MGMTDLIKGMMKRDEDFKVAEKEVKINRVITERQKNSNERELERYLEEDRQKMIKQQLEAYRKRQQDEMWHGDNMMKSKNIFKGHTSILTNNDKLLKNNGSFLRRGNMFK